MTDDPMLTWKVQRLLKQIHRENEDDEALAERLEELVADGGYRRSRVSVNRRVDRVTEAGLEALRAYDPDEWDSLDEYIEACVDA